MTSTVIDMQGLAHSSVSEFIAAFESIGPRGLAKAQGVTTTAVFARRRRIEKELGIAIRSPTDVKATQHILYPHRLLKVIDDGMVIVFGDCHYWPGRMSTAHRALVRFITEFKPSIRLIVANGDIFDGAAISRYPSVDWSSKPTVRQELEACATRMGEIEDAAGSIDRVWNLGNHDARFEALIVRQTPEMEGVQGTSLADHFPGWEKAWATWINDDVVIRHRGQGGIHATRNNTLNGGMTIVTNHLHSQKVAPFSDYRGTRWGVDTGCIAAPYGPEFLYNEDKWVDWRSGFAALTFAKGELLTPECIRVHSEVDGSVDFRGRLWTV